MVEVVFFDVDDASAYVLERRWHRFGGQKTRVRARAEIEEKEDDATARGEKRRAKCARGETTDAGKVDSRSFWRTFRRRVRVARGGEILKVF